MDVALAEGVDLDAVEQAVSGFAALLKTHPSLEAVLLNPAVPAPRKRAAVTELVRQTALLPIVGKLVVLLAGRDRLVLVPDLLAAYRERLLDHRNVVRAAVTTAAALEPGRTEALERSLAEVTGRTVMLDAHVDASLIGGVVARIGSTVYDGSVVRQLAKMRERIRAAS
jgi:F-type H+-transporting ATPase subunit delta